MRFAVVIAILGACASSPSGKTGGPGGDDGDDTGSNPGGSDDPGSADPITVDAFLQQMAKVDCDEAFACKASFPTDAGGTFDELYGSTATDCYAMANMYNDPVKVASEITAGKIHFDGSAAATCVAGITFGTCTEYWDDGGDYPAACDGAISGTIADGSACVVDYDCSNVDSYCTEAGTCGTDP